MSQMSPPPESMHEPLAPSPGPGRAWYLPALLVAAATIAGIVVLFPGSGTLAPILQAQGIEMPGTATVTLAQPGSYFLYLPVGTTTQLGGLKFTTSHGPRPITFVVTDEAGTDLPISGVGFNATLKMHNREYAAVGSFTLPAPGQVTITGTDQTQEGATGGVPAVVGPAFTMSGIFGSVAQVLVCLAVACLGFVLTLGIFLLVFLKRRRRAAVQAAARQATPEPL